MNELDKLANDICNKEKSSRDRLNPWAIKQPKVTVDNQQSSAEFIAQGGKVVDGGVITRDRLMYAKKCGASYNDGLTG